MYGWIWRHLPGNAYVRALTSLLLILALSATAPAAARAETASLHASFWTDLTWSRSNSFVG